MNESKIYIKSYSLLIVSCALLLSIFTLMLISTHPVSWPATASLPGVVNMIDGSKLSEDFYAQSSMDSPTIIFQKLILYTSLIFNHDPIKAMVLLGSITTALYFPLFFLIIQKGLTSPAVQILTRVEYRKVKPIIILGLNFFTFIMALLFHIKINSFFTLMSWPPIFINPSSFIISMLLGLWGAVLLNKSNYICIFLIAISCLVHPSMGFFTAIFSFLLLTNFSSIKLILINIVIFFSPVIFIFIFLFMYYPKFGLNTHDFMEIYVYQRHPHHYLISESLHITKWALILGALFAETTILFFVKNRIWINALLALIFLLLIPPIHFLLTEVFQMKIVAIFGFPRFLTFAFFLVIFFGLAATLSLLCRYLRLFKMPIVIFKRISFKVRNIYIATTIILLVATTSFFNYLNREYIYMANFLAVFNEKYKDILFNVPDTSVLLALDIDNFHFGLFGKKNLYSSEAFPFSEFNFYEYAERRRIYDICNTNFSIHSLLLAKNKYNLNYLLMNKNRLHHLPGATPVAEADNLILINVDEYLSTNKLSMENLNTEL